MDDTKITLSWPNQDVNATTLATTVKNAFENDRLMAEIDGQLFVIPVRNVKYFQVSPAPDKLPSTVLRVAKLVD